MLLAKPIIDEKFWIIERNGEKVGTLRKTKDLVLTINQKNFKFTDIESLCVSTKNKFTNETNLLNSQVSSNQIDPHTNIAIEELQLSV